MKREKKTLSLEKAYDIIRHPLVTEKTTTMSQYGQFSFAVAPDAHKSEIKDAVEKVFKVKVTKVNTSIRKGKQKFFKGLKGYRNDCKRAIVTLEKGQSIDFGTGV